MNWAGPPNTVALCIYAASGACMHYILFLRKFHSIYAASGSCMHKTPGERKGCIQWTVYPFYSTHASMIRWFYKQGAKCIYIPRYDCHWSKLHAWTRQENYFWQDVRGDGHLHKNINNLYMIVLASCYLPNSHLLALIPRMTIWY